jgi:hypothetical protein
MVYLFTAIEFPPGGGGKETDRQLYTKGETINNTIQKHKIHKIENKKTNKNNIKNHVQ